MVPEVRVMVMPVPGPVRAAMTGLRRLAPMTIWVALLARANFSTAAGMSSPAMEYYPALRALFEQFQPDTIVHYGEIPSAPYSMSVFTAAGLLKRTA